MTITTFIAPFEPPTDPATWDRLLATSDLTIDPAEYQASLQNDWPLARFLSSSGASTLEWYLYERKGKFVVPGGLGTLQTNRRIVTLEPPNIDFCLWHRSIISAEYRLWMFTSASWSHLEIRHDTTRNDILQFLMPGLKDG
jgi:hypothetical protein